MKLTKLEMLEGGNQIAQLKKITEYSKTPKLIQMLKASPIFFQ